MKNIVIMGECMLELASTGVDDNGRATYQQSFAGDTFNTAVYLKRTTKVDSEVHYLTCVGKDKVSQQFIEQLKIENISTDHLFTSKTKTLGLYMINTDQKGERSFSYWRNDSAAKQIIECCKLAGGVVSLKRPDLFYFSGISLAILSEQDQNLFWPMLTELRQQGCIIAFDPNYRPALWADVNAAAENMTKAYQHSDIALPGIDEQLELFGDKNIDSAIKRLVGWGVQEVVIKNGEQGCSVYSDGKQVDIPADNVVNVIDTTAAGDSFNGGYLSHRIGGCDVVASAEFAAKIAAFVVQHKGAIVGKKEFTEYFFGRKGV